MQTLTIQSDHALNGETSVPGDKSLSHRAVMFGGLLAHGRSHVKGWLRAGDTVATLRTVQALGITIKEIGENELIIHGTSARQPEGMLNLVNAGTGIRLLAGIMVGQPFASVLDGSEQLRRRPMKRIITPLRLMGAEINGVDDRAPLHIQPSPLTGIRYEMPVASAQVKSAVILAALFANGETTIIQPGPARDHTEVMLGAMGANITVEGDCITVGQSDHLAPFEITVPGDFSSAAFPMVAACIVPGSEVTLRHINLNPTRTGLLDALLMMGAQIDVVLTGTEAGEPVGDIHIRYAPLRGVDIGGDLVVRMIDEFPALMVAALCAEGTTIVREAQELRVKETDRIAVMADELRKLGAEIAETADGFSINGPQKLTGATVHAHDDHRIAMSMTIAGLVAVGQTQVEDAQCAADSFPGFAQTLAHLGADVG
ncbi:MAG: 3-phosphoshikimate 1-carboxyvinyltransferase [Chloroflexi bacterium AL-W]|nr:3-phosphoshikimate 1-carboxyvinyltransferase [Chloroflexi bacterium AL-W]